MQLKTTVISENAQQNTLTIYYEKLNVINKQQTQSNINQKNISMFLQNSHFHEYLLSKDVDFLCTLIEKPEKSEELHLNLIYNQIISLCYTSESVINSFSRRILQLIFTEKNVEFDKNMIAFKYYKNQILKKIIISYLQNYFAIYTEFILMRFLMNNL